MKGVVGKMLIETERLLLRPFEVGDAEDVFEYLKKPAVNCFADMKLNSIEEARQEVLQSYLCKMLYSDIMFVITDIVFLILFILLE